jgi:hypothetical protein
VRVSPAGVQAWLARDRSSVERDLVECLLASPVGTVPDMRARAHETVRPAADLARALFHLNRGQCLWIGDEPNQKQADGAAGLAGLSADLQLLAGDSAAAVISDSDGLCLAASGWRGRDAERAASRAAASPVAPGTGARWWFSLGEITIAATIALDPRSAAWVRIARRLLHAGGPLASRAAG